MSTTLQEMAPILQGFVNCEKFLVVERVIAFRGRDFASVESDRGKSIRRESVGRGRLQGRSQSNRTLLRMAGSHRGGAERWRGRRKT